MKYFDSSVTTLLARAVLATTILLSASVAACKTEDPDISGLAVNPNAGNKGDTLGVDGQVDSKLDSDDLSSISYTITDQSGATPQGIGVQSTVLANGKSSWDLAKDGQVKIAIATNAPSGTFHFNVEAKTKSNKTFDGHVDFTVH
jgi:hypothetical protein